MIKRIFLASTASFLTVALAGEAAAQAFNAPGSADPGRIEERFQRDERPLPGAAPVVNRPKELLPETADEGGANFTLTQINLQGVTVFPEPELKRIYYPLLGKSVTLGDLKKIANEITAYYRNKGYILTRAIVPPQRISNGTATIHVVEGYIDGVDIQGGEKHNAALLRAYSSRITSIRPLNNEALERYLLLMDDLTGTTARGVLSPSPTETGASRLTVTLEHKQVDGNVSIDNRGSRFLGPIQYGALVGGNSVLGLSERLQGRVIFSGNFDELRYYEASYNQPVGPEGTTLRALASYTDTRPGGSLEQFDVEGDTVSFSLSARHPLLRSRRENLYGDIGFRYRDTQTDVLNFNLYDDHIRSLYIGAAYDTYDFLKGVNRLEGEIVQGLDIFDATDRNDLRSRSNADTAFTRIETSYTRLQYLTDRFSGFVGVSGQYAFDALYASEEFAIGGEPFGTAYDPAEITGDHGVAARAELRYSDALPEYYLDTYQLYIFYDGGKVWNRNRFAGEEANESLTSTGAGVRFSLYENIAGTFEVAVPLTRDVSAEGSDGDDVRGFFSLNYLF